MRCTLCEEMGRSGSGRLLPRASSPSFATLLFCSGTRPLGENHFMINNCSSREKQHSTKSKLTKSTMTTNLATLSQNRYRISVLIFTHLHSRLRQSYSHSKLLPQQYVWIVSLSKHHFEFVQLVLGEGGSASLGSSTG